MRLSHYADVHHYAKNHWWHLSKIKLITNTLELIKLKQNSKILDIGCGTGIILSSLTNYKNIYGIDNEPKAIQYCKKNKLKNVTIGNAQKLSFPSNFFDCLIVLDVLEHVDENIALSEFVRVLKPGGYLIITVPAYQWMWSKWDEILMHKKRYTKSSLSQALTKHQLIIYKITYLYSFILIPTFLIRKIKTYFKSDHYSSDLKLSSNHYTNSLLLNISSLERKIANRFSLPFGLSIYCVAKKAVTTSRFESKKPLQV